MRGFAVVLVLSALAAASQAAPMDAGSLAHAVDRLAVTGRVLYVAAHPDDENTRLLAYLANHRHLTVAYLSMTRGGGGQNLIGREQAQLLDILRSQELLAARRIDGARQRFTSRPDFGYSKSAEETLSRWGREAALAEVVEVVREFRPDVIVTRFNESGPNHGHHTASAILAREAFEAASDPTRFPEQIARGLAPWKATRVLYNVPNWRNQPAPEGALPLEVGLYDPRLGLSYGELAARSRSQHRSQGFGVPGDRGGITERFTTVAGSVPAVDPLDGVPLGWVRFGDAGTPVQRALDEARAALERDRPEKAVKPLASALGALDSLPDVSRVRDARRGITEAIAAAAGLFVRATAARPTVVPGGTTEVTIECVMRREAGVSLVSARFPDGERVEGPGALRLYEETPLTREVAIPRSAEVSAPVSARDHERPVLSAAVEVEAGGRRFTMEVPLVHAWTDPVLGERVREVLVVPPASATPVREAFLATNGEPATVEVRVRAARDDVRGAAAIAAPAGWRVEPTSIPLNLAEAADETVVRFSVTPPPGAPPSDVFPTLIIDGREWSYREDLIDYPHIPLQRVSRPSTARVSALDITIPEGLIGYIPGSGDTVAEDLAHLGMRVDTLDDERLASADLSPYRAIVVGIRAYNTSASLRAVHGRLMRYVEDGGTVVVQYNTRSWFGPLDADIGPYPLEIGRGRITDEHAEMSLLLPEHTLLTKPNRITAGDFGGWVQERGLYFADNWDPRYEPVLAASDPGEEPLRGGLLFAAHGKGRYVYTGLSFFRQLPAGVPGAYRLFVNLLGPGR
jgi:LmbE family N-acetylglucosaminyl deacetylase